MSKKKSWYSNRFAPRSNKAHSPKCRHTHICKHRWPQNHKTDHALQRHLHRDLASVPFIDSDENQQHSPQNRLPCLNVDCDTLPVCKVQDGVTAFLLCISAPTSLHISAANSQRALLIKTQLLLSCPYHQALLEDSPAFVQMHTSVAQYRLAKP